MSKADLSRRSGIPLPTIRRLLSGDERRARTDIVAAIAEALGVEVRLSGTSSVHETTSVAEFRHAQAARKATRIAKLVQGTMALEAAVMGPNALDDLIDSNFHALLAGPARRLWGD